MRLGFIGTGKIASSVITGICTSKISFQKILISRRNKNISKKLRKRFGKVYIAKNNQEIVDKCNWIFLAVTPKVGKKILPKLKFRSNQKVVSFIATINLAQLKKTLGKRIKIVRAIPLPPISLKKGPVPISPPDKQVKSFFDKIGTTIEVKNEKLSKNFWATSAMMAPFYEILKVLSDWLVKRGIKRNKAQKYITSLFVALSVDSVNNSVKHLKHLVADSQTPGGLNEQAVKGLRKAKFYRSLEKSLNTILKRLK
ncbi:MAG: pyrroline-5-carboxylate reductase [Candidatus Pelagibacter sp.]|jgi:pyrroline-5-carboxylate reductase|nr:pyrroline-5-carboxylate reductase [Candidatus Pelagibacter sp.]|tara:strand:+ start:26 stop:790 length:765 start_codon:yes stop_codon:yes gene_type:complete